MNQIRQGDVLLMAVNIKPPKGLKPKQEIILAEGELTGHAHRLRGKEIFEWNVGGQRYFRAIEGELSHEDHDPTPVRVLNPDVTYQIIHQQEWSLEQQWRRVVD